MLSQGTPATNAPKPTIPTEIKSEPAKPATVIETEAEIAKKQFAEAESYLKEKKYTQASLQYINTITNAKNAIENSPISDGEMYKLIEQSIRNLLTIVTEQNDLFEKCRDDFKMKLAQTLIYFSKVENFKKNIPIYSEADGDKKLAPLCKIAENIGILTELAQKDKNFAKLYAFNVNHTMRQQEHKRHPAGDTIVDTKKALEISRAYPAQAKNDLNSSIASNQNSLFHSPVKLGFVGIVPGVAIYSIANAGLQIALWGGFYGFLLGAVGCYAGNKLADYCKPKRPH